VKITLGTTGAVEATAPEPTPDQARLTHAARQFEAVLLRKMLSCLEKTTQMQAGKGGSMYGTMVVDAMADAIVGSGGIGMAKLLEESLPGTKPNNDR
jgi:Rod binding domain-containing protein